MKINERLLEGEMFKANDINAVCYARNSKYMTACIFKVGRAGC